LNLARHAVHVLPDELVYLDTRGMTDQGQRSPYSQQPTYAPQVARPPLNGMALGAFISVFFVSVVGLVLGYIALGQIKQSGEGGRGLALAAVILGWISIAFFVLVVGGWFVGGAVLKLY